MSRRNSVGDVTHEIVICSLAGLAILVLLGPVIVVLITSFTDSQSLKFPPQGFSLILASLVKFIVLHSIHLKLRRGPLVQLH
jgi:ABC-type spermidine/putrescine transport system permease subunit II